MKRIYISYILALAIASTSVLAGCSAKANNGIQAFNPSEGLTSQGVIEAKDVSINSKVPGRILKIYVEEGTEVKAGDPLVEMSSDEIKAKEGQALALLEAAKASYEAAKGQAAAASSQLAKAQNGARAQEIAQAQASYDLWSKTYERVSALYAKGAVSAQKLDEVKTQKDVAEMQLSIAKEGARSEEKSGAQAQLTQALAMEQAAKDKVDQAQAGVDEVRAYLNDTNIKSPIDGVVTALNADEGELVSTGMSIGTVSNLKSAWVEAKIKETDLEKVHTGQDVDVRVSSYPNKTFKGKVVRVNQKPDFATKRSTNDNGDFDILSFGVKIELRNDDEVLRPGMTAFVQFKK